MTLLHVATAYLVSSVFFSTYSAIFTYKHWTIRTREKQHSEDMTALLKSVQGWKQRAEDAERSYKAAKM